MFWFTGESNIIFMHKNTTNTPSASSLTAPVLLDLFLTPVFVARERMKGFCPRMWERGRVASCLQTDTVLISSCQFAKCDCQSRRWQQWHVRRPMNKKCNSYRGPRPAARLPACRCRPMLAIFWQKRFMQTALGFAAKSQERWTGIPVLSLETLWTVLCFQQVRLSSC